MIKTTRLKTSQVPKNITYDLTPQVDGVTQTFELPEKVYNLDQHYVLFNGQVYRNDVNHTFYTISADGMELTTLFDEAPRPGASYVLQFVKTESAEGDNAVTKSYVDGKVADEAAAREDADIALGQRIDTVVAASDVKDIVGTYADLESYDTSTLGDNDIIKVLSDETHGGAIYYYRWNANTETFAAIGSEGPYYTKSETNTLLGAKQNTLTAGENITIENDVISATGGSSIELYTTYGQNTDGAMTQKATTDLVYTAGDPTKINIGDNGITGGTNTIIIGSEDSGTISSSATDIIAIGHDITESYQDAIAIGHGTSAGINAVSIGKSASAGSNAVAIGYLSKGFNTNQSAYTAVGYKAVATNFSTSVGAETSASGSKGSVAIGRKTTSSGKNSIAIGSGSNANDGASATGDGSIAIGHTVATGKWSIVLSASDADYPAGTATEEGAVSVGTFTENTQKYAVALGAYAKPRAQGVVDVSTQNNAVGYNLSKYRLISGVHDGEELHDAATVAQGNTLSTTAPTTTTVGVLGQLYTDTTNMHTYQLTAIDTTDPDNPVYTWTQRW